MHCLRSVDNTAAACKLISMAKKRNKEEGIERSEIEKSEVSISKNSTEDYYFEQGLMVMTESYHLQRGYCCDSGCRHCPYKTK